MDRSPVNPVDHSGDFKLKCRFKHKLKRKGNGHGPSTESYGLNA